jgi:hypothetical protein
VDSIAAARTDTAAAMPVVEFWHHGLVRIAEFTASAS